MFLRIVTDISDEYATSIFQAQAIHWVLDCWDSEDEGSKLLRNLGNYSPAYITSYPGRRKPSPAPLRKLQIWQWCLFHYLRPGKISVSVVRTVKTKYDEHIHNFYSKKTYGIAEVKIHMFLHLALGGGAYSFALRLLYSGRQSLYDWLDGLVEKPRRWSRWSSGAPCSCCGPASSSSPSPVDWPIERTSRNCHSFLIKDADANDDKTS